MDANAQANEQEWLQDNREMNDKFLGKDYEKGDDVREHEIFWSHRENDELNLWSILYE